MIQYKEIYELNLGPGLHCNAIVMMSYIHLYYYLRDCPCLDSSFFSSKMSLHFYA